MDTDIDNFTDADMDMDMGKDMDMDTGISQIMFFHYIIFKNFA